MDVSLDDYMKTNKSFNSNRRSGNYNRGGGRPGPRNRVGMARTQTSPKNPLGVRGGGVSPKKSILSRLGKGPNTVRQANFSSGKFSLKPLAMDKEERKSSNGNFKIVVEDARQKIGRKGDVQDARLKLSKKNTEVVDARDKLKRKISASEKRVTIGRPTSDKTVTIGKYSEQGTLSWSKTISNDTVAEPNIVRNISNPPIRSGITRAVTRSPPPVIVQPFSDKTDLTIVRNFRPSLATFSVDNPDDDDENGQQIRVTRKVPGIVTDPVFSLPDYSDLLKDTRRKLDAGQGDLYYGKMQADREWNAPYAKIQKVSDQRTLPVESPMITVQNEKKRSDPIGIIPLKPKKKTTPIMHMEEESMEVDSEIPVPNIDMISPLQGFKVTITNLHPAVTQDDIIELFASIGALKKARLVKKGSAEVVYVKKEDALSAVKRYNNRLLDNLPMIVRCVASANQLKLSSSAMTSASRSKEVKTPVDLNIDIVHKALFKSRDQSSSSQPVQFLVKI